ncbi:hypothetical protein [Lentzea sp. NPDC092896]|uniref:hypothetical protein n=1 Tax=Lentzea sp. NPDC092896 TaxID=3364127 RepID=UPI00382DA7CB
MTTDISTGMEQADVHEEIQPGDPSTEVEAPVVEDTAVKALNAVLIRAAVANRNAERFNKVDEAAKADVVRVLGRKGSLPVMNPLNADEEFVQITVSKLTYTAKVVDPSASKEWVKERYADKVEKQTRLMPGTTEQHVFNVLKQFAPYLLEEVDVVPDHVINELALKSRLAQRPMGFGGEVGVDAPPGIVVEPSAPKVYVTFRNPSVVDDLIVSGIVDMEGNMLGGDE